MTILYESKTGHTKRYADILAQRTGMRAFSTAEIRGVDLSEEVIFFGWMKVGKVQGLNKARGRNIQAVCCSGTARAAEPDDETVITRNKIEGMPFFYLRGGCKPLRELKGLDKMMLSAFVRMLKGREQDEKTTEAISIVENGFDGVKEENLEPLFDWLRTRRGDALR